MAKRFTDTDKYKKPFLRTLPGPYKLFWDFLIHECNYAGIWIVDFEIAQIYIGTDMKITYRKSLELFNTGETRIYEFDEGKKWFILPFLKLQYRELSETNVVHIRITNILETYNLLWVLRKELLVHSWPTPGSEEEEEVLKREKKGVQGKKEPDADEPEMKVNRPKEEYITPGMFERFWELYPKKSGKGKALKAWETASSSSKGNKRPTWRTVKRAVLAQMKSERWQDRQFIPFPATWLNQYRWLDDPEDMKIIKRETDKAERVMEYGEWYYLKSDGEYYSESGNKLM